MRRSLYNVRFRPKTDLCVGGPRHMRTCHFGLAAVLVAVWGGGVALADPLVTYTFEGEVLTAASAHSRLIPSGFGYNGDGTTGFFAGHDSDDAWRATVWPTNLTPDDAFTFSITIAQGYVVDLTDLSMYQFRSGTGPTNWIVRYSRDGTTYYDLGDGDTTTDWRVSADSAGSLPPFDLTGTVYFRIHAVGASGAAGTWRVDDVALNGDIRVDDRMRVARYQSFDDPAQDNWSFTTNAAGGDVTSATAMRHVGPRAARLTGSAAGNNGPDIRSAGVDVSSVTNLQLRIAYAADEPDTDEDLVLDVSYDNFVTADTVTLVGGFNGIDLAFGSTSPRTQGTNPYVTNLPAATTQVGIKVRFDETSGNDNTNDHYFVDDIRLLAEVAPPPGAPQVSVYGDATGVESSAATVRGHVTDGYPYPDVTLYYGPFDGGTNASAWAASSALGLQGWGIVVTDLSGLDPGTVYYYRYRVENANGVNWASTNGTFRTVTAALSDTGRMYLDSFGVGTNAPLCVDADRNGLSDRWEEDVFGGTGMDPEGHSDADGVCDADEFLAGTDPTDADSFMRIVSLDLRSETSSDIAIVMTGGDRASQSRFPGDQTSATRRFRVRAADNSGDAPMAHVGTVVDGGTGSNVFTDVNATELYSARYYDIAVSFGGEGYTNTEQWAMHVQDRTASEQFLVCVPVRYGGTNDNLQGTLGRQLARGLYRTLNTGDVVRFWTDDGVWVSCLLTTNASGGIQWTTNGCPTDIDVTPGMAMWVYRSGHAAARDDAVFAGKSFTSGDVAAFNFKTNAGGWTAFGWPLPQPRRQRSDVATADQLGFVGAGGTGGRVSTTNAVQFGDELWVWKNNTWQGFYSLLDEAGASWDGRWWDNYNRRPADIVLEPGAAYYYRNRINSGGDTFTWTPEVP